MSKITLEPNASGAGTFTLAAPDSNTNRTLNLPDESGVLFSDGSGVPGSAVTGQLASSNMAAGSVIQVVQTVKTNVASFTAGSSSGTLIPGFSLSFTPTSVNNKVLVSCAIGGISSTSAFSGSVALRRDGSIILAGDADGDRPTVSVAVSNTMNSSGSFQGWLSSPAFFTYLDSPNTTDSVTYDFLFFGPGGSRTYFINRTVRDVNREVEDPRFTSSITVTEIAG